MIWFMLSLTGITFFALGMFIYMVEDCWICYNKKKRKDD